MSPVTPTNPGVHTLLRRAGVEENGSAPQARHEVYRTNEFVRSNPSDRARVLRDHGNPASPSVPSGLAALRAPNPALLSPTSHNVTPKVPSGNESRVVFPADMMGPLVANRFSAEPAQAQIINLRSVEDIDRIPPSFWAAMEPSLAAHYKQTLREAVEAGGGTLGLKGRYEFLLKVVDGQQKQEEFTRFFQSWVGADPTEAYAASMVDSKVVDKKTFYASMTELKTIVETAYLRPVNQGGLGRMPTTDERRYWFTRFGSDPTAAAQVIKNGLGSVQALEAAAPKTIATPSDAGPSRRDENSFADGTGFGAAKLGTDGATILNPQGQAIGRWVGDALVGLQGETFSAAEQDEARARLSDGRRNPRSSETATERAQREAESARFQRGGHEPMEHDVAYAQALGLSLADYYAKRHEVAHPSEATKP